jgi:hypothetical protein
MTEKLEILAAVLSASGFWGAFAWILNRRQNKRLKELEAQTLEIDSRETEADIIEKYKEGLFETQNRLTSLHAAFLAATSENSALKMEMEKLKDAMKNQKNEQ